MFPWSYIPVTLRICGNKSCFHISEIFLDLRPRVFMHLDLVQVIALCRSTRADRQTDDDVLNVAV